MNDGIREGVKESETGPVQTTPTDRVSDFSSRFPRPTTLDRTEQRVKIERLCSRVGDWKGHPIDYFGELMLDDVFLVTASGMDRVFHVFLFEEAILFFEEEGKRSNPIRAFLKKLSASPPTLPKVLLKGRIYFRHIKQVVPLPTRVIKSECVLILGG